MHDDRFVAPPAAYAEGLLGALDTSESVSLIVLDDELRYTWMSRSALSTLGIRAVDALGRRMVDVLGDDLLVGELESLLRSGLDRPITAAVTVAPGRERNVVAFPLDVDGRRCVGLIGMRLLPELKRSLLEQRLRESLLIDAARLGLWIWDRASGESWWNSWTETMLGYDEGKPKGSSTAWESRVHPSDRGAVSEMLQLALETGARFESSHRIVWPTGEVRHVRAVGQLLPEHPNHLVGVLIDVTESRRGEEREIALQQLALAASDAERDRIAADIHDGPLQGLSAAWLRLSTLAARLEAGDDGTERASGAELADFTRQVAQSLATTNQELREVLGRLRSLPVDSSADTFVNHLLDLADDLGAQGVAEIDVVCDFGGRTELPGAALSTLYRIVAESMVNAARHSGGSRVDVDVRVFDDRLDATVADDGVGFDTSAPAPSGHFGLSIMGQRARSIGGKVSIRSSVGAGTVVEVTVPLDPDTASLAD